MYVVYCEGTFLMKGSHARCVEYAKEYRSALRPEFQATVRMYRLEKVAF